VKKLIAVGPLLLVFGCVPVSGAVSVHWSFTSANYSCSAANVSSMQVQVGGFTTTVNCVDPNTGDQGTTIGDVPPGTVPFTLTGFTPTYDSNGNVTGSVAYYQATGTIQVVGGANNDTGVIQLGYITQPSPGSVSFHWAFTSANYTCAYASVSSMQVKIGGITATVGCIDPTSGDQGATIAGVPGGTQPFTLTAYTPTYDSNGNPTGTVALYQASGSVQVVGGANNDTGVIQLSYINPPAQNPANSNIVFLWNFLGQTCASTPQVATVRVQVTDNSSTAASVDTMVACNTSGTDGIQVQNFAAGTYPFTLTGLDSTGTATYQASGSATVDGLTSVNVYVTLVSVGPPPTGPGNAQIAFTFGSSGQNCQQVGVDSLHFSLSDSTGAPVAGSDVIVGCMTSGGITEQVAFNSLTAPAVYYLYAQGLAAGSVAYTGNFQFSVSPMMTSSYQVSLQQVQ
jgi:hypothetical protein